MRRIIAVVAEVAVAAARTIGRPTLGPMMPRRRQEWKPARPRLGKSICQCLLSPPLRPACELKATGQPLSPDPRHCYSRGVVLTFRPRPGRKPGNGYAHRLVVRYRDPLISGKDVQRCGAEQTFSLAR